jgi:hypothetical protein
MLMNDVENDVENDMENDRQFAQLKMTASHSDDKYFLRRNTL